MGRKIVIVGGNAGGATSATRLRRLDEEADIVLLEKGKHVSWANCGLPYFIGDEIENKEQLLVESPEAIGRRYNLDVRTKSEAIDIDPQEKEITVEDRGSGDTYREAYDKLILSPGAEPVKPPIESIEEVESLYTLRDIPDASSIKEAIGRENVERALIVGGGFVGLEMAENLSEAGLEVTLVEMMEQVLPALDYEMAAMLQNHLRNQAVDLYLENSVTEFEQRDNSVKATLKGGEEVETDLVILATGVRPKAGLAEKAGLEIGESGGIRVDEFLRTSETDIYAIGDAIEVRNCVTGEYQHIPLAGPANRQGRIAANNIGGQQEKHKCSMGTFIVKVFNLTAACTGANERDLDEAGLDYEKSYTFSSSHVDYYPGSDPMWIKLLFDPESGIIYGSQIVGHGGVDKRIDVLSTAIKSQLDVFELQELDLAYAPPYSSANDPVNVAGFVAGNIVDGIIDVTHWHDVDSLEPEDTVILDVRSNMERSRGHIEGSKHIPLSQLRDRLDELPEDKTVVPHCSIGLRSYIASRILIQNGYDVKNLSGGFGIYSSVKRDQGEDFPVISCSLE